MPHVTYLYVCVCVCGGGAADLNSVIVVFQLLKF